MIRTLLLLVLPISMFAQSKLNYPVASLDAITDTYFGTTIADPYRWLEDDASAKKQQWVTAENTIASNYLLRSINRYMMERQFRYNRHMNFGTINKSGKYYFDFYMNFDKESSSLYIKKKIHQQSFKIVDPNDFKENKKDKVTIAGFSVSEDNNYVAYSLAHNGSDWREIRVKTLFPFRETDDYLKGIKFSHIAWYKDGFFYLSYPIPTGNLLKEKSTRPAVYYHKLGTAQVVDKLVYVEEAYPDGNLTFEVLHDEKYLIIYSSYNKDKNDNTEKKVLKLDLDSNDHFALPDTIISSRQKGYFNVVGSYAGQFLVHTNFKAPNGKFVLFNKDKKNEASGFIEHFKKSVLVDGYLAGNKLMCIYLTDIDYSLVVFDSTGAIVKRLDFPPGTSIGYIDCDKNDPIARFNIYSFLYPSVVYEFNTNTLVEKLVEKTTLVFNVADFDMKKVYYPSKDGDSIPMILAYKKSLKLTGETPTMLYGYGGYGTIMTPFYDEGFMSHIQNGGIVALPCLRGGGEMGDKWHEKGKGFNKQNVFDDFISAAEYLFKEKYTDKAHLAIMGGSNGGLLVAAVINQRPDICRVAIATKGIYDMFRYQLFTAGHYSANEFGSSDDSMQFLNLKKYSPLHNIKAQAYPSILVITADHDDRAVPLHSYKYVAELQKKNTSSNPILLYVEKNEGHTTSDVDTKVSIYSFIYNEMDIPPHKIKKAYY